MALNTNRLLDGLANFVIVLLVAADNCPFTVIDYYSLENRCEETENPGASYSGQYSPSWGNGKE